MQFFPTVLMRYILTASILLMLLLISGCQNLSSIDAKLDPSIDQIQQFLKKAKKSSGAQRADWLLLASESLLIKKRTDKALAVLNTVNSKELSVNAFQLYHLLMAEALSAADRTAQALYQYHQINQPELLKKYQQIRFYRNYAGLLNVLLRHYDSALQRIALAEFLTDELEIEENRELLWISLMQVSNLEVYRTSLNGFLVSGWLELANLAKLYADQPDVLLTQLEQWRSLYSTHPAYLQMPIDMARAMAARSYQPQRIALLLPESGSLAVSANQIRDGFLSAIFQLPMDLRPELQFYDTSNFADILAIYQKAIDQGANLVIGPLHRDAVQLLASREIFPVPVLTINRLNDDLYLPDNFYQFGLPVEDEARLAAIRAWEDGLRKALVLVPTGTVGERTNTAFTEQFEKLGGEIQQLISYNNGDDYSRAVQALLGVDKSIERHQQLERRFGITLEYDARRRQDSDFIFFKASFNQARRIKPFIDFYYAQDLPLYSTSSIYSGKEDTLLDRDLNDVLFCDIPWLLSEDTEITEQRNIITAIWPDSAASSLARFFALGYDLFTLIPDLNKLRNFPHYQKQGLSGSLSVDQLGHIQRNLSWAKFINGKAVLLDQTTTIR